MDFPFDNQTHIAEDIIDALSKIGDLNKQTSTPDRTGMIEALRGAVTKAELEIRLVEIAQGYTVPMSFEEFSDEVLYKKLHQYREGLKNYIARKIGQNAYEELMKEQ